MHSLQISKSWQRTSLAFVSRVLGLNWQQTLKNQLFFNTKDFKLATCEYSVKALALGV